LGAAEYTYKMVDAAGSNGEIDFAAGSCIEGGCFAKGGLACPADEICDLASVPMGRCAAGDATTEPCASRIIQGDARNRGAYEAGDLFRIFGAINPNSPALLPGWAPTLRTLPRGNRPQLAFASLIRPLECPRAASLLASRIIDR